jgi:hypothetical protein
MTIKLASLKVDLEREETGDWIEFPEWPGVDFNVSSIHKPAYVLARDVLLQRLARQHKGKPVPVTVTSPQIGKLYATHLLHGWRGLDVEYSPETALETLSDPAFRAIVNAVEYCAGQVSAIDAEYMDDAEGNSAAPSGTK